MSVKHSLNSRNLAISGRLLLSGSNKNAIHDNAAQLLHGWNYCGKSCYGKPNKRFTVLKYIAFKNHKTLYVCLCTNRLQAELCSFHTLQLFSFSIAIHRLAV